MPLHLAAAAAQLRTLVGSVMLLGSLAQDIGVVKNDIKEARTAPLCLHPPHTHCSRLLPHLLHMRRGLNTRACAWELLLCVDNRPTSNRFPLKEEVAGAKSGCDARECVQTRCGTI